MYFSQSLRRIIPLTICVVLMAMMLSPVTAQDEPYGTVDDVRYSRLSRGVNLSHWFWLIGGDGQNPINHFQTYITMDDVLLLKDLGIRHVRVPIDMIYLFDWDNPESLNAEYLPHIDAAIQMFIDNEIAVMVTPFGSMDELPANPQWNDAAAMFWQLFSTHLNQFDPEYLFIQIANEPQTTSVAWNPIQAEFARIIRQNAPEHTIITGVPLVATEEVNGAPEALAAIEPLDTQNVVYNMHFYEPFFFTLQGATWVDEWLAQVSGIPYPSFSSNMNRVADRFENQNTDENYNFVPDLLRFYAGEVWNEDRIEGRIQVAVEWAIEHQIRMIVDEFGVYRYGGVSEIDRLKYLQDIRTVLERNGIAWTVWDYNGLFGLTVTDENGRSLDRMTAVALGLNTD